MENRGKWAEKLTDAEVKARMEKVRAAQGGKGGVEEGPVPETMLDAMKEALRTKGQKGGDPLVQIWRGMLKKQPTVFLGHLAKAEAAFQAQKGKGSEAGKPPPAPEKVDEGTERVLALLAELRGAGL